MDRKKKKMGGWNRKSETEADIQTVREREDERKNKRWIERRKRKVGGRIPEKIDHLL